jgi:hypothetical protein
MSDNYFENNIVSLNDKYNTLNDNTSKIYVVNPDDKYRINFQAILYNGVGYNIFTRKPVKYDDLKNNNYEFLNQKELYNKYEGLLNSLTGKWTEITKYKYDEAKKNLKPYKLKNGGFFSSFLNYGNLRKYYQIYKKRYFSSLQRTSYSRKYIIDNLISNISRFEPLSEKIKLLKVYLEEYNKKYYNSFISKGKINTIDNISYDILNSYGFKITKINKSFYDGIDGIKYDHTYYNYDINNQTSEKNKNNKYDQFAIKYITYKINNNISSNKSIYELLKKMSFKGDILNFSKELYLNKNDKYKNTVTLSELLNNNNSNFAIIPPSLPEINSYIVSNNININNYLYNNENITIDNINVKNNKIKW